MHSRKTLSGSCKCDVADVVLTLLQFGIVTISTPKCGALRVMSVFCCFERQVGCGLGYQDSLRCCFVV